ncbi:MAG: serine hydrolase [archaeon]|nr:serine hydrolase [archaeon]
MGTVAFCFLSLDVGGLLSAGAAFRAKTVCSGVFVSSRTLQAIDEQEFDSRDDPMSAVLLALLRTEVDSKAGLVVVSDVLRDLFGLLPSGTWQGLGVSRAALHRGALLGCSLLPRAWRRGQETPVKPPRGAATEPAWEWPVAARETPGLAEVLEKHWREGDGAERPVKKTRAIVVAHRGEIVAERYADSQGFGRETPQLGWSVTKTLLGALVGARLANASSGLPGLDEPVNAQVPEWKGLPFQVTLRDLMLMESGLDFEDEYSITGAVVRMLFNSDDAAHFAASRPFKARPGQLFAYSSGVTNILSRLLRGSFADAAEYLHFPLRALFAPLGMRSAVMETDAAGHFVGSSFSYATPRDYAKFGQLLLQKGAWKDPLTGELRQIVPQSFVEFMATPGHVNNTYGGQTWLNITHTTHPVPTPVSAGTVMVASGHDCQMIAIVPQHQLVVVRLGFTKKQHRACQTADLLSELLAVLAHQKY